MKINQYNLSQQQAKEKSHGHINRCGKIIWQNPTLIFDKTQRKLEIEATFLNSIKSINGTPIHNTHNKEKLEASPLSQEQGKDMPSYQSVKIILEIFANATR